MGYTSLIPTSPSMASLQADSLFLVIYWWMDSPCTVLKHMGYMVLAHIKLLRQILQGQIPIQIFFYIISQPLIQVQLLPLTLRIILFMDDSVQVQDQVIDTQGYLRLPAKPFGAHFINKPEDL